MTGMQKERRRGMNAKFRKRMDDIWYRHPVIYSCVFLALQTGFVVWVVLDGGDWAHIAGTVTGFVLSWWIIWAMYGSPFKRKED